MPAILPRPADSFNPDLPLPASFAAVAATLYASDPYWLGEDSVALQQRFSRSNDFFRQGNAWVGVRDGAARLAGFVHPQQRIDDKQVAYFGYWETLDEVTVNQSLFAELEHWARGQGAVALYGPIDFNTYGAYRLRLNDFDQGTFPGEPHNPEYYPRLLQALGFGVSCRYQTRFHPDTRALALQLQPRLQQCRQQLQSQFQLTALSPDYWLSHLDELYPLVDVIFRQNFAYTPITRQQFYASCGEAFALRFCPRSSVLATTPTGAVAGFFLCFPDYSPLLRQRAVNPVAAADLRFDQHAHLLPTPALALAKTGGVHPDFRQSGLFNWMGMHLVEQVAEYYPRIAGALMREDNHSIRFGQVCPIQRDYGLFRKPLG